MGIWRLSFEEGLSITDVMVHLILPASNILRKNWRPWILNICMSLQMIFLKGKNEHRVPQITRTAAMQEY